MPGVSAATRVIWVHGLALEEKDAVTGVQTLRNALMVVALTSQAAAYIGARALPDLLFNPDYQERLHQLPVRALAGC